MNFIQLLACDADFVAILRIVRWVVNIICFAIPIILIVLCILDIAKIVTAGNIDDKLKKEVTNKVVTRIVFAVIIFLVPTIIGLIFNLIPSLSPLSTELNIFDIIYSRVEPSAFRSWLS